MVLYTELWPKTDLSFWENCKALHIKNMLELLIEHYPNHLGIIKQLKLVCNNLDCSRGSGSPFNDLKAYYQVQGFTDQSRLVQDQEVTSGSRTGWFCSDRKRTEHFENPTTIWRSVDPWLSHSQSEQKTWWSWTRPRIQISRSSNLKRKTNSLRNLVPFSFSFCQGKFQRFR